MNNEETKKLAVQVREIIKGASDYSQVDPHQVFIDMEALISALASLTSPMLEAEQAYRRIKVKYIELGKSAAEADARARASDEYLWWRKLQAIYNLAEEQIKICKKWSMSIEAEYNRTR